MRAWRRAPSLSLPQRGPLRNSAVGLQQVARPPATPRPHPNPSPGGRGGKTSPRRLPFPRPAGGVLPRPAGLPTMGRGA